MKTEAMRLVCAKHVIDDLLTPGTFFWLLCDGRLENGRLLINTVAEVVEAWTPPQLDDLSDELISQWINQLKFKSLVELYQVFNAPVGTPLL